MPSGPMAQQEVAARQEEAPDAALPADQGDVLDAPSAAPASHDGAVGPGQEQQSMPAESANRGDSSGTAAAPVGVKDKSEGAKRDRDSNDAFAPADAAVAAEDEVEGAKEGGNAKEVPAAAALAAEAEGEQQEQQQAAKEQAAKEQEAKEAKAEEAGELWRLFVGALPADISEEDLKSQFSKFGSLSSVAILRDASGACQGSGFALFDKKEDAESAITALDGQVTMKGMPRPLEVRFAKRPTLVRPGTGGEDNRELFFSGAPFGVNREDMFELLSFYGKVERLQLISDPVTRQPRGSGFVTYRTREAAADALAALNGNYTVPGAPAPLAVRWSDPHFGEKRKRERNESLAEERERQLFVAKILKSSGEAEVRALFSEYGTVDRVFMFKPTPDAIWHKGSGVITMSRREEGAAAIRALDEVHVWPGMKEPMVVKWMDSPDDSKRRRSDAPSPLAHLVSTEAPPAGCDRDSLKLHVSNIPLACTVDDVRSTFKPYGKVVQILMARDKATGQPKGAAMVWMQRRREAEQAIRKLHGSKALWEEMKRRQAETENKAAAEEDGTEYVAEAGPNEGPAEQAPEGEAAAPEGGKPAEQEQEDNKGNVAAAAVAQEEKPLIVMVAAGSVVQVHRQAQQQGGAAFGSPSSSGAPGGGLPLLQRPPAPRFTAAAGGPGGYYGGGRMGPQQGMMGGGYGLAPGGYGMHPGMMPPQGYGGEFGGGYRMQPGMMQPGMQPGYGMMPGGMQQPGMAGGYGMAPDAAAYEMAVQQQAAIQQQMYPGAYPPQPQSMYPQQQMLRQQQQQTMDPSAPAVTGFGSFPGQQPPFQPGPY